MTAQYETITGTPSYRILNGLQDLHESIEFNTGDKDDLALVEKIRELIHRVDSHKCGQDIGMPNIASEMSDIANGLLEAIDTYSREDEEKFLYCRIAPIAEHSVAIRSHQCA